MKPWATHKRVFTPGQWAPGSVTMDRRAGRFIRPVSGGLSVCQITVQRPNWRENARLVAMAPVMYGTLTDWFHDRITHGDAAVQIRSIMDHVTGLVQFPEPKTYLCSSCRRGYEALGQTAPVGLHCPHKEEPEDG